MNFFRVSAEISFSPNECFPLFVIRFMLHFIAGLLLSVAGLPKYSMKISHISVNVSCVQRSS